MCRKLILLLFLCLCIMARGQALYEYRYWFDGDESTMQTGSSDNSAWQMDLDIGALDANFHIMHFQVKDAKGVWSVPMTRYFIKLAQKQTTNIEYWFDNDTKKKSVLASGGKADIEVSALAEGMHIMHLQASTSGASYSSPQTAVFWKQAMVANIKYRLWFDKKPEDTISGKYTGKPVVLDVSKLDDGFHILHAQVESNTPSKPLTSMFIKVPQTQGIEYMTCALMVDEELYKQEKVSTHGGIVNWTLDATGMKPGLHKAQAFVVTQSGAATAVKEAFFYRSMTTTERSNMKCLYSIDGDNHYTEAGTLNGNLYHFDLDVANLSDGFHRLSYMLIGEDGTSSKVMTSFFVKTPLGGNGIMQYDYWLNDNEANRKIAKFDTRTNPLKLITLLPVDPMPIRSSCFHFEVGKDGKPMMYAKNDLHMRFYDVAGRLTETSRQFVDYKVSEEVKNIKPIIGMEGSMNAEKPSDNNILWYSMSATIGDSIAVRSSMASTLQVFSPSGKEVYSGSGSESVNYGGFHAGEEGTYYVALHDVTGTNSNNISLDYLHLDKYDVIGQNVKVVGDAGYSTITFDGNGFDYLTSIDLISKDNVTIKSVDINHLHDYQIEAMFDFKDIALGEYDMVFHFVDEDRTFAKGVVVEESKDITITANVQYPQQYLRNSNVVYTLTLTNNGNSTAYAVPVYTYISTPTRDGISKIKIDGVKIPGLYDNVDLSEYTPSERKQILDQAENLGDERIFIRQMVKSGESDSLYVRSGYLFVNLAPNSSKNITFTLTGNETIDVEFTIPEDWMTYTDKESVAQGLRARSNIREQYCCIKDKIECIGNIIGDVVSLANTLTSALQCPQQKALAIADCGIGFLNKVISATGIVYCDNDDVESKFWEKLNKTTACIDASNTMVACVQAILPKLSVEKWDLVNKIASSLGATHLSIAGNCVKAFSTPIPNCPPVPPSGGKTNPVNSLDPNDIYGYLSESGSKYIRKGLDKVSYTIEFENDPEFATASAHEVTVSDVLDGRYFDLNSFVPTSVKVGDKYVSLNSETSNVITIDMRPEINAIAQVEIDYDSSKGVANWKFSSLDPMTMEKTDNPMSGFLPVNNNGNGIGEVTFDIALKQDFEDGDEISNSATITFDFEEPIETPVWTNTVDAIAPKSEITFSAAYDGIVTLRFDAEDNRSGIWKYNLYVQDTEGGKWTKVEDEITTSEYKFKGYPGFDYGFCVMAVDMAGNVEQKELTREISQATFKNGDVNSDGKVNSEDVILSVQYYITGKASINFAATDVNKDGVINSNDIVEIVSIYTSSYESKSKAKVRKRKRNINKQISQ